LQHVGRASQRGIAAEEQVSDLNEDDEFWRFQANSLAILATSETLKTFRWQPDGRRHATNVTDQSFQGGLIVKQPFRVSP
jgi:hypothetical protein